MTGVEADNFVNNDDDKTVDHCFRLRALVDLNSPNSMKFKPCLIYSFHGQA